MNPDLQRLYDIASKKERIIIGLMSGTSLDGLDVALCRFRGSGTETSVELLRFCTVAYSQTFKDRVRAVFARRQVDLQQLCMLHPWIGLQHAEMVLDCLSAWSVKPEEVDLIASHGQTVYHLPGRIEEDVHSGDVPDSRLPGNGASTLQLGDGDHIAVRTGIGTLSDFRQKHIAAGGEGAPLAVYGDYLLFSDPAESRILLNIGGIANYTFLPAREKTPRSQAAGGQASASGVYSTDVGPGNTLIDAAVRKYFGRPFDEDGKIARSGRVNEALLSKLKDHPFFGAPAPKTTGPELFNMEYVAEKLRQCGQQLPPADLVATLTAFSARVIAETLEPLVKAGGNPSVYLSGGGAGNPVLAGSVRNALAGCRVDSTSALGIDPGAKEAVLFATLANETVAGKKTTFAGDQHGIPSVSMGKISFPG